MRKKMLVVMIGLVLLSLAAPVLAADEGGAAASGMRDAHGA